MSDPGQLRGPIGRKVWDHRARIQALAAEHGLSNLRVFGSVARSEETEDSDVDLLVDLEPGVSLVSLARAQRELEMLLGVRVELVPAADLKPGVRPSAFDEAIAL